MTHRDADRELATEKYLLGEMTHDDMDAFEEHMFDCSECAAAVKRGAAFTENARAVFQENPGMFAAAALTENPRVTFFEKWFSFPQLATSFAALALLCIAGYQYEVIAGLRAPHSAPNFALVSVERSADVPTPVVPAGLGAFTLRIDSVSTQCLSGCAARIRYSDGRFSPDIVISLSSDRTALIALTREKTPPGDYRVVVHVNGPGGQEVGQYPFRVE